MSRRSDIPHDRMRLKIAENMVRAVAEAPHVTALFEADFSAIAAHKAALAATRREAQLHRLYRQGRRRSDGGRAGNQRPLGRTGSRSRRRSTSASAPRSATRGWSCRWSRTPARSASSKSARSSTTSPARARDGKLTGRTFRAEASPSPTTACRAGCLHRRSSFTRGRRRSSASASSKSACCARGRRGGCDSYPADGLCHAHHRSSRSRRSSDQRLANSFRRNP